MPDILYQDGANQRATTSLYYQDGANLRTVTEAWYQDGANLRKIWPAAVVALTNHSPTTFAGGGTATASFTMSNTGAASGVGTSGGGSYPGEWMIVGPASAYDVRFTIVSGALSAGTAGSWLNLGTSRTWTVQRSTPGTNDCQGTVEIRDATTLVVLATATITLTADRA